MRVKSECKNKDKKKSTQTTADTVHMTVLDESYVLLTGAMADPGCELIVYRLPFLNRFLHSS